MSTAYHPQTERQMERTNQVLELDIRTFANYDQNDWYQILPLAEHAYNNTATNAHKITPFFANYGFHPQTEVMKGSEAQNPWATMYCHWIQDIHGQAKQTLEKTWESMKKYYDRKATKHPDLEVGDMVMLNAKKICTQQPSKKLRPKLYALFRILERNGGRAYKLEISPRWKIHPVFHVSLVEHLSSLEPTKSRTTPTRSRLHRGRPRVGGRKNSKNSDYFLYVKGSRKE